MAEGYTEEKEFMVGKRKKAASSKIQMTRNDLVLVPYILVRLPTLIVLSPGEEQPES